MSCPFRGVLGLGGGAPATDAPAPAAACPFSGRVSEAEATPASSDAGAAPAKATCPLGFTSSASRAGALGQHACPRCRAYLFDAVELDPCGHVLCLECAAPSESCLVCGRDVSSRPPAAARQASADAALAAETASTPEAMLTAALASASGGAPRAALARARAAAAAEPDAGKRAALAGLVGDFHKKIGDMDAAAAAYEGAVALFEGGSGDADRANPSAAHAATVSLTKLGDVRYEQGGPAAALPLYERALGGRLAAAGLGGADAAAVASAPPPEPTTAGAWVDAGVAAAKVADAASGTGAGVRAASAGALAAALLAAARAPAAAAGAGTAVRASRLASFLEGGGA